MPARPILIDIPTELESSRLLLRCPRPGDGIALNSVIIKSISELQPWFPWAKQIPSIEDSEEVCRKFSAEFILRKDLVFHIFTRDNLELIGSCGLHRINWDVPSFEIGYWLSTSATGNGYMTEVVNTLSDFCLNKLGAKRVEIRMDDRNEASWRVAERAGFKHEATLTNNDVDATGQARSTRIYLRT